MDHLNELAKKVVELSLKERLAYMNTIWIGYTQAKNIYESMNELLDHPPSHRMPNILIVGASNNGKSYLLKQFINNNKAYVDNEDLVRLPVLRIQMPYNADENEFFTNILDEVQTPYKKNDRLAHKKDLAIKAMKSLKVKVLIVDEVHDLLVGSYSKQRVMLNLLKYLSNKLQISLVCAGTKAAFQAIQTDPQLLSRFTPYVLPRWRMDEEDEYLSLLASFNEILPLKRSSDLFEEEIATKILSMTDRTIGQISSLLKKCAKHAIKSGAEQITISTLKQVKWKTPADMEVERSLEV